MSGIDWEQKSFILSKGTLLFHMSGLLIPLFIELSITALLPQCLCVYFSLRLHLQPGGRLCHTSYYTISNYCNHSNNISSIIVAQALYCPSIAESSFLHVSPAHLLSLLFWMGIFIPSYLYWVTVCALKSPLSLCVICVGGHSIEFSYF